MKEIVAHEAVNQIILPNNYKHIYSGKVRETFEAQNYPGCLFMVATDRISTLDVVHNCLMAGKGVVLTQLASFWFDYFKTQEATKHIPTQLLEHFSFPENFPADLRNRTMMVKKLNPIPIEAIVRGYLYGSAIKEYEQQGTIAGIQVESGLITGSKLSEPIFAPSTKAPKGQHDENIDFQSMIHVLELCLARYGMDTKKAKKYAKLIKEYSLVLYKTAADFALQKGIIIADTKFEFGFDEDGILCVMDELVTPDSSRFRKADGYKPGIEPIAFDKQALKTETAKAWHKEGKGRIPLVFSQAIIQETIHNYKTIASLLIGKE